MVSAQNTGMEIKLGFFFMAFFLFACTPTVEIDGQKHRRYWGRHFFPLSPGPHTITVYFWYFFMSQCGKNTVQINVQPGQVTRVEFNMPPWMFAAGSLYVR